MDKHRTLKRQKTINQTDPVIHGRRPGKFFMCLPKYSYLRSRQICCLGKKHKSQTPEKIHLGYFPMCRNACIPDNPTAPERSSDNNTSTACLYDTPDIRAN